MKLLSSIPLIAISVVCLQRAVMAADAPSVPPAAAPIVIVNFTGDVPQVYGYGTWQNAFAVAPNAGFRVQGAKGAQGDGGFCQELNPGLDLSGCKYIEIALAVQNGNEVPDYNISLGDADGTHCSGRVHVSQLMPGQPVWLRLNVSDFVLSTRDPGADGKMDWSKVTKWHLQGDWVTKKPAQILFIALRARP